MERGREGGREGDATHKESFDALLQHSQESPANIFTEAPSSISSNSVTFTFSFVLYSNCHFSEEYFGSDGPR